MSHWELEKANYPDDDGAVIDWFEIMKKYVVPGMLVLAVAGVIFYSLNGSDISGISAGNIFQDLGRSLFDFGAMK